LTYQAFRDELLRQTKHQLSAWSVRYGVSPPELRVLTDKEIIAEDYRTSTASYDPRYKRIIVAERFLSDLHHHYSHYPNPEEAMVLAKNIFTRNMAHEFGHHMSYLRRPWGPPGAWEPQFVRRLERVANIRAWWLTGKTVVQEEADFIRLMGLTEGQYHRKRRNELAVTYYHMRIKGR